MFREISISTTPLDLLALAMFSMLIILCCVSVMTVLTVTSAMLNIDVDFDEYGYALLITQGASAKTGFGIIYNNGLSLWKYQKARNGLISETKMFSV
ncbi:MAG: hypothetical protein GY853_10635 [PVC group bacterium]|nr:hypothetical protein [PVC group bacterium]